VASLAAEMTPYVSAAVGAYGGTVLAKVRDETADATVSLGRRLLRRVFGARDEGEPLPGPLADLVADRDDDALAALRLAVRRALAADPGLAAEVRSMLADAPHVTQHVRAGRNAYTAGRDQTIYHITGDSRPPAGLMPSEPAELPRVKDAKELDQRVRRAVLPIPYVRRDVEGQARGHLEAGRPVLLVGSSMVGKTRMAVSLIRDMFADHPLVMPDGVAALGFPAAAEPRGTVVFLDDVNRHIGAGGITDGMVHRLVAAGCVIVATIRAADYDRYQATDQFRSPEWDVLSMFERVFLSRELSPAEEDRLHAAVADGKVRQRIIRTGLGEYVGAAERIDEVLRYGPSVCPLGYALVRGAVDWRCAGMKAPVPAALLPPLAQPYLRGSDRFGLSDQRSYQEALQWATRDINPTVALLQRDGPGLFSVFDYALDVLARPGGPIPDTTWEILVEHAEPDDLISVGYTAEVIFARSDVALLAWQKAAESDHADGAPVAACNLAVLAQHCGDPKAAQEACQRAMDSGHADHAPMAAVNLGTLLQQQGDMEGARAAYQQAIDWGHCDHAPRGWLGLGTLLEEEGDANGAREAYLRAAESSHADTVGQAMQRLKDLQATPPR
jgi:tetratricopeptide (TPR) repeat protein